MRLARALIVAGVVASAAAIALACTSFGDGPSTPEPTPATDAGNVSGEPADAGPDGTCTFFGGAPAACASPKHLVAQFTSGVPAGFTLTESANVDPGAGFCTPGFLHAQANVVAPQSSTGGTATATIDGAFKSIRIAYALRGPRDLFPGSYVELGCEVWLIAAPQVATVMRLDVRGGGSLNHSATVLGDAGAASDVQLAIIDAQQTAEERARFRKLEATYSWGVPGPASIQTTLAFDGQPEQHPTYPLLAPVTSIRIACGVTYADQGSALHVADVDDVVIDACE